MKKMKVLGLLVLGISTGHICADEQEEDFAALLRIFKNKTDSHRRDGREISPSDRQLLKWYKYGLSALPRMEQRLRKEGNIEGRGRRHRRNAIPVVKVRRVTLQRQDDRVWKFGIRFN